MDHLQYLKSFFLRGENYFKMHYYLIIINLRHYILSFIVSDPACRRFPIKRDAQVQSLLVTASLVTPEANIIYAPIGPYKTGLIETFDASNPKDLEHAKECGLTDERCNVVLQVAQNRTVKNYLLPMILKADADPLKEFNVGAINVPAEGKVTSMSLLHVPNVVTNGVGKTAKVLATWKMPEVK
jgi:hypothetical protein